MNKRARQKACSDNQMKTKILFVFVLLLFFTVNISAQESTVENFNNLLSFTFSLGYNYILYEQSSLDYSLWTNRPWDMGIGFGILNFSFDFSFSIPFLYDRSYKKSQSYDFNFNHYNSNKSFSYGYIKYYSGFHNRIESDIDLRIFSMGISQTFILNKSHSIRSVYNLDKKQTESNGSFLIGAGAFFSSINSNSEVLNNYSKEQNTFYFGPVFGYSYIWVFESNLFINVLSTFGLNLVINNWKAAPGFQILPKFSVGYHGKTWSGNIYFNFSYLTTRFNTGLNYNIFFGDTGLSFIKRFL